VSPISIEVGSGTDLVWLAVYMKFFRAAKGHITIPLLLVSLVLMQAAQVLGSYWLVFWQEDQFNKPQGCTSLFFLSSPTLADPLVQSTWESTPVSVSSKPSSLSSWVRPPPPRSNSADEVLVLRSLRCLPRLQRVQVAPLWCHQRYHARSHELLRHFSPRSYHEPILQGVSTSSPSPLNFPDAVYTVSTR
jgi:hypothetical protein